MNDETDYHEGELPLENAGQRLVRAREAAGLTIEDIAAKTRIARRYLESIEANDFSALPSRTYVIGFSRTYARAVGLDDTKIVDQVRDHLSAIGDHQRQRSSVTFEPGDPARIPSRALAWFSGCAALLLIVGAFAFFRTYFISGSGPAPLIGDALIVDDSEAVLVNGSPSAADVDTSGQVVFTSIEDGVWVKFYDAAGETFMEKQMAQGEKYSVPSTAVRPQIWTGQPKALSITIGGQSIGTLASKSQIIRDVEVTAAALIAAKRAADDGLDSGQ